MKAMLATACLTLLTATIAPSLSPQFAISSAHAAAPCRDAKGKFTKCPAPKPVRCKDAKGRFAKCGTDGANPV
ncbi:hypothetical protein AA23498_2456 [Acetobacter nitrogenifigens DSM 23921 = NBRC 105050]|uniref:Uncharacterized protein n=1 Tax=Acetobacter nitrogenifigens DSM 23921 = NBRC 105050 TaxID=1120919 RepID=A0A511X7P4_9PROT|nr:hypothetical protein [Acetobacter nitrogenifigens]GBQ95844.1 hypothetical protein AA23498_2456 [Acetobacter nitrogenifigens DSM 23921 = NBRC 105050]GEN58962.1 hypothetical protein ANI02nite_08460 [Acetobacter nitrogenifigens DSM 23921 = NBRC 105050]